MNKWILMLASVMLLCACTPWHEMKAPCTYDERSGCGDLIYSHETLE